jgi:predicted Co/Zn/Cd cation transporter (cation efflux family)
MPPQTNEFQNFRSAVRDILKVSPSEMKTRIEAHKESGKRLSKGAPLDPAASSKVRSSFGKS